VPPTSNYSTPQTISVRLGPKIWPSPLGISMLYGQFVIGQFKYSVLRDVSSLDYVDLLLCLLYQQDQNVVYMTKTHQYTLSKYGHTYVLTKTPPKPTTQKDTNPHVHMNQCVSLCLIHPIQPYNTTHPVPKATAPLL
jgi:hypothetical protein